MRTITTVYYEGGHGGWTRVFYGEPWGSCSMGFLGYTMKEIAYKLRNQYGWRFSKMEKIGD